MVLTMTICPLPFGIHFIYFFAENHLISDVRIFIQLGCYHLADYIRLL
jgi:hypothetical protein